MSKYLLAIILPILVTSISVSGQSERMLFGAETKYKVSTWGGKSIDAELNVKSLFSESFENENLNKWVVMRSADTTGTGMTSAISPAWFHCKPSDFSGNGNTYIHSGERSAAIRLTAKDATWLITKDTMSLTEASLAINFWLYYVNQPAGGINTYFYVMAKEAGTSTWQSIGKWENSSPSNEYRDMVSLPIPSRYNNKKITIAFVYLNKDNTNSGFQLAIDDLVISDMSKPSLSISPYHYKYSTVPLSLVNHVDLSVNAFISNMGADYAGTGAEAKVEINDLTEFTSAFAIESRIETGKTEFIKFEQKPEYTKNGEHTLKYSLQEEYGKGMTTEFIFTVSPTSLATDYCSSKGIAGGFSAGMGIPFGNRYQINNDIIINGIEVQWPIFDVESLFMAQIYELNPHTSTMDLIVEKYFTRKLEDSEKAAVYPIDPLYITAGAEFFVAVKQINDDDLLVAYDKVPSGQFWRLRNGNFELLSSPSFGNIGVRARIDEPTETPAILFTVKDESGEPIAGVTLTIEGQEPIETNDMGKVNASLQNGIYTYTLSKEGLFSITETVTLNRANVTKNITMYSSYKLTLSIKSSDEEPKPLENAEVLISSIVAISGSNGDAVTNLPKGIHSFKVLKDGYSPITGQVELVKDSTLNISLSEQETSSITFNIASKPSKTPLEGVKVDLGGYGVKYTDNLGKAVFTGIMPTSIAIAYSLSLNGYLAVEGETAPVVESIVINDTLSLQTYYLQIEVTDGLNAVDDAQVTVNGNTSLESDPNGIVVFSSIAPGANISIAIRKDDYLPLDTTVTVLNGNVRTSFILEKKPSSTPIANPASVSLYPNPNTGLFNVESAEPFQIKVFDITGRLILSSRSNMGSVNVNIMHKPSGMYFVRIESNNLVTTYKVVKQ